MDIISIKELRKHLPASYKEEAGSVADIDETFYTWPTEALPKRPKNDEEWDSVTERSDEWDIDNTILDMPIDDEEVINTSEAINETFDVEQPFPGQPGTDNGNITIDTLAFYLPYHIFKPELWGIYLLVEGVASLSQKFRKIDSNIKPIDSVRLAKAFLFYHESFHNCVETFATRMEIANRSPFYITGVNYLYQNTPPYLRGTKLFHEEAFANKYAIEKASEYFSENIWNGNIQKDGKEFSKNILKKNIRNDGLPKYKDSLQIETGLQSRIYKEKISEFQEEIYHQSLSQSGSRLPMSVWKEFGSSMRGNLPRGSLCSYITTKKSRIAKRARLSGLLFKTKKFETYLARNGASFGKSSVHQKKIYLNGSNTDMPINRDIDPGTASKIIKKLNLRTPEGKIHSFSTLRDAVLNS